MAKASRFSLRARLMWAFGSILAILLLLAGAAWFLMRQSLDRAESLSGRITPFMADAALLLAEMDELRLSARMYGALGTSSDGKQAAKRSQSARDAFDRLKAAAASSPELAPVVPLAQDFQNAFEGFLPLLEETRQVWEKFLAGKTELHTEAGELAGMIEESVQNQTRLLESSLRAGDVTAALQEHLPNVTGLNQVLDSANEIFKAFYRSLAEREQNIFDEALPHFEKARSTLNAIIGNETDPQEKAQFEAILARIEGFEERAAGFLGIFRERQHVNSLRTRSADSAARATTQLVSGARDLSLSASDAVRVNLERSTRLAVWGSLGALALGLLIAWRIGRSLSGSLSRVAEDLSESSAHVSSAAAQIAASSESLADGASEQAASLEETSASLEEISSMTKRNAENAQAAKHLADQTRSAAEAGVLTVEEMNKAMAAIQAASGNISKIIKTIDEIAFQTNILALNAAVEAARAGEAGAGFAVVAGEVRALAQRSAQAAKETAERIQESIRTSAIGVELSAKVSESLAQIVEKARQVDELVGEIATASREQSQGIEQVNGAVAQMDKVTQNNAAAAQQGASASQQLKSEAEALIRFVSNLEELLKGSGASHRSDSEALATRPVSESGGTAELASPQEHPEQSATR